MKYIAIGDIHGRRDLLQKLLQQIDEKYPEHMLLFLGDYVDRGPDSYQVITKIKELCDRDQAIAVMGNHEAMMIDYVHNGASVSDHIWLHNGGHKTMRSYMDATKQYSRSGFVRSFQQSGHFTWMKTLPLFYETDEIWASHAPIDLWTGKKGEYRTDAAALYWTYEPMKALYMEPGNSFNHGKLAVCGHIHRLQDKVLTPRIYPQIVYADTGCGCAPWGPLTGVCIEDGIYINYIQAVPEEVQP